MKIAGEINTHDMGEAVIDILCGLDVVYDALGELVSAQMGLKTASNGKTKLDEAMYNAIVVLNNR